MSPRNHKPVQQQIVDRVCALYGLEPIVYIEPTKGYRNRSYAFVTADRAYTIILYKDEPDILTTIQQANRFGDYAASQGYPARQTVDGRLLRVGRQHACLYYYLPGGTIPWEAYTRHHLRELGRGLAELHHCMAGSRLMLPPAVLHLATNQRAMQAYFTDPGVIQALDAKLRLRVADTAFDTVDWAHLEKLTGQQPLHLDFVRGNVLFMEGQPEISGVIDFEKAAIGHPIIDVARTLAFLVVDSVHKTPPLTQHEFLVRGYQSHSPRFQGFDSPRDVNKMLSTLVNHFLLYDLYKFLRHNPYEALPKNHHFMRTASLLMHKKLLVRAL